MSDTMSTEAKLARLEELEARDAERRGHYEEVDRQRAARADAASKQYESRINLLTGALEKTLTRRTATDAIRRAKPDATPDDVDALMPHVLPHLKMTERADLPGVFDVIVTEADGSGRPRSSLKTRGQMSADELVEGLRDHAALGRIFEPSGGARSSGRSGERVVRLSREERSDPVLWQRLKARHARGEIDAVVESDGSGRRLM